MNAPIGVLLAAGKSGRFGGDKLTSVLPDGLPMGVRAAQHLLAAVPEAIAVVRSRQSLLADQLARTGCRVVVNPSADLGLSSSLAVAVRESAAVAGWVVALGDMPWIRPETIAAIANCLQEGASLAAPSYAGQRGHPVGLAAHWRETLLRLRGDQGARELLREQAAVLRTLEVSDPGVVRDVDLPADLARGMD